MRFATFYARRRKMNYRRLIQIVLSLSIVTVVACSSIAQKPAETTKPEGSKIIVKGKIVQSMSRYFVTGESPPGEFIIVNENTKLLDELLKSGRTVTIEGREAMGADSLFIEKIDGQPYRGK
jgi:hypothetical protein